MSIVPGRQGRSGTCRRLSCRTAVSHHPAVRWVASAEETTGSELGDGQPRNRGLDAPEQRSSGHRSQHLSRAVVRGRFRTAVAADGFRRRSAGRHPQPAGPTDAHPRRGRGGRLPRTSPPTTPAAAATATSVNSRRRCEPCTTAAFSTSTTRVSPPSSSSGSSSARHSTGSRCKVSHTGTRTRTCSALRPRPSRRS
jgi:hypothetical protein